VRRPGNHENTTLLRNKLPILNPTTVHRRLLFLSGDIA